MEINSQNNNCSWEEIFYNYGEPDNRVRFSGTLGEGEESHLCIANRMSCYGQFRDGPLHCFIDTTDDGKFVWGIDEDSGVCDSWAEAWQKMPAMISNPDHRETVKWWCDQEEIPGVTTASD